MGDIADWMFDQAMQIEFESLFEGPSVPTIWITKTGEKILVTDMTNEHLRNSINMIKRNNPSSDWIEILQKELNCRK